MKKLLFQLQQYWFAAISPLRLAILRIATGCFSLWYLLDRYSMLQRLSRSDASLFESVGLAKVLSSPLSPETFQYLLLACIALNIAYILGWQYRWTGPGFALTLLFFMCYRNSWSMIYHNYNSLVLTVFIIGWAAAADALSLDRLSRHAQAAPSTHWRYGWPVKLICAATVAAYFLSGLAKIMGDLAWAWIDGSAMRSQVAVDALRKEMLGSSATPLFEWLYPHTWLFFLMGFGTLILELGAPLVLLNKRLAWIWAVLAFSMHWGIYFIMGIDFPYHLTGLVFLPFFELEKGWTFVQRSFSVKSIFA